MGGYKYKSEEDNSLKELIKDNPDKNDSEIARMAYRYSICPNLTEKALVQRIGVLKKADLDGVDCIDGSHGMRAFLLMKADRDACFECLDEILNVLIGSSKLYIGMNHAGGRYYDLTLDIPAIHNFLWTHYDDLVKEKIEQLKEGK